MSDQSIILFDGVCNLCNRVVLFVIKHDKSGYFKFASLQSDYAKEKINLESYTDNDLRSLVLIQNGKIYWKSTAALKIAKHLSGGWKIFSVFLILPRFLRDPIYDFVARHRYKWFGKRAECMVPDPSLKKRFIEG